jgi:predicted nucleic acid-binding protein
VKKYVFDSYSLLAFLEDEPGADLVERVLRDILKGRAKGFLSVINLGEIYYITLREQGKEEAEGVIELLASYPLRLIDADWSLTREAAVLKGKYRVAYADCFAAALGRKNKAAVLTGDPEFKQMEKEVEILWLP